jgi:hypothetical protein
MRQHIKVLASMRSTEDPGKVQLTEEFEQYMT